MHRIPKIFAHSSDRRTSSGSSSSRQAAKIKPRLDRRNASKDINYDYSASTSSSSSSLSSSYYYSSEESQRTRSLDLYGGGKTSFRIDGVDGEIDILCKTLGFSGIDDFGISPEEYEVMKVRSCSAPVVLTDEIEPLIGRETEVNYDNAVDEVYRVDTACVISTQSEETCGLSGYNDNVNSIRPDSFCSKLEYGDVILNGNMSRRSSMFRGKGINGVRPPVLEHQSLLPLPAIDKECSAWVNLRAFSPENDASGLRFEGGSCLDEVEEGIEDSCRKMKEDDEEDRVERMGRREENIMLRESYSFTTSNDDDSSSTTTEPMSSISPNGRGRRIIVGWQKGELLGRGSFGSVYEGIADDGTFFAVKEVSLLAQGDDGRQSIIQLEQEIALLSQFKHENIVQYFGTKKDESHLYIFLELVTKGSLLSLYQKYCLKDPQVSAYTRQILRGLKYLHDRDVVHRDIKCANILVDTNGLVKLADFGLARATKLNDVKSCKGTAFWMAPEVVRSLGYGLPADIWSLGCTVLEMLTRRFPYFNLECMQALFRIGRGERPTIPDTLSSDARDFILKCLQVDPSLRPTAAQLLDHPFVKQPLPSSSGMGSPHNFRRQI